MSWGRSALLSTLRVLAGSSAGSARAVWPNPAWTRVQKFAVCFSPAFFLHYIMQTPRLIVSDGDGNVFEIPELDMAARHLDRWLVPEENDLLLMPYGSSLYELPHRTAVGYDRRQNEFVTVSEYGGRPVVPVAAFMAPAHTHLYHAAFIKSPNAPLLPLFAYTAAGWRDDNFWVCGIRVDEDIRQDTAHFNPKLIEKGAQKFLGLFPRNQLVEHLVNNCVRRYHCPAAQNMVLERWECPLPTSPACNARCIGCISKQEPAGVPVTQDRLTFVPAPQDIVDLAVRHLDTAPSAIVSFGQGCEGEPLLQGDLIEAAIRDIRKRTPNGTININTNASKPAILERLCRAGLDSIRVSLNSAQPELYNRYFQPRDYAFKDVLAAMNVMRRFNKWISLNYFIFPGLSDSPVETDALATIIEKYRVDYIQMRNLNIDPDLYIERLGLDRAARRPIGIRQWKQRIKTTAPWIRFGYFNPPKENW